MKMFVSVVQNLIFSQPQGVTDGLRKKLGEGSVGRISRLPRLIKVFQKTNPQTQFLTLHERGGDFGTLFLSNNLNGFVGFLLSGGYTPLPSFFCPPKWPKINVSSQKNCSEGVAVFLKGYNQSWGFLCETIVRLTSRGES